MTTTTRTIESILNDMTAVTAEVADTWMDTSLSNTEKAKRLGEFNTRLSALQDERKALLDAPAGPDPALFAPGAKGHGGKLGQPGPFAQAILDAGFSLRERPSVTIPLATALNTFPNPPTWAPRREGGVLPLGRDERFIFPWLQTRDIGTNTSVEDFRQSARTVTGNVERAVGATTDKAVLDLSVELVTEPVVTLAVLIEDVPNALLESIPLMSAFLEGEGLFVIARALDSHVYDQIIAASPPNGNTGTGLVEQVRHAVAAMRAAGSDADLLVLNPTDAVALDLATSGTGTPYLFPVRETGASPLWGLRVVEHTSQTLDEAPLLIDTRRIGPLFRGTLKVEADPFTGFKQNLTRVRFEVNALMNVRAADAAYVISAGA